MRHAGLVPTFKPISAGVPFRNQKDELYSRD